VLQPLSLGTSSDLVVGQHVYALGNPFGLDHSLTTRTPPPSFPLPTAIVSRNEPQGIGAYGMTPPPTADAHCHPNLLLLYHRIHIFLGDIFWSILWSGLRYLPPRQPLADIPPSHGLYGCLHKSHLDCVYVVTSYLCHTCYCKLHSTFRHGCCWCLLPAMSKKSGWMNQVGRFVKSPD